MSPARAQSQTSRFRDERPNHETTAPPYLSEGQAFSSPGLFLSLGDCPLGKLGEATVCTRELSLGCTVQYQRNIYNFYFYFNIHIGRRQLLKCLLEIHALCCEEDPWFLLNELYLTDYCIWIQKTR